MRHWHDDGGEPFSNSDLCFGREYSPDTGTLNVAKISIRGRFPEIGYLYNEEAHEMAVVVSGEGMVQSKGEEPQPLAVGDVIYIAQQERIFWSGNLDLIIPCSPAYNPDKHHVEE